MKDGNIHLFGLPGNTFIYIFLNNRQEDLESNHDGEFESLIIEAEIDNKSINVGKYIVFQTPVKLPQHNDRINYYVNEALLCLILLLLYQSNTQKET